MAEIVQAINLGWQVLGGEQQRAPLGAALRQAAASGGGADNVVGRRFTSKKLLRPVGDAPKNWRNEMGKIARLCEIIGATGMPASILGRYRQNSANAKGTQFYSVLPFPRKREPSQIKHLDSRFRGNDELICASLNNLYKHIFLIFCLITVAAPSCAHSFEGPLETKNQFPLFTHLNSFSFEKAGLEKSFAINFAYSSVFFLKTPSDWETGLDMEVVGLNMRARKIFFDSLELGIEVPLLGFNAGCMDGAVNDYHGIFDFSSYGRNRRPKNDFLYEVKRNGVTIVKGEAGQVGLSDIRLSAKKALVSSDQVMSIKLTIELPTGDARKGFGSGNIGTDISFLLDKPLGEKYISYYNLGVAFPGDLDGYEKVNMRQFVFGGIAFEMAAWKKLNLLAQMSFQSSPYPKTGIRSVDSIVTQLTIGGRYLAENGVSYDLAFTEDMIMAGSPDFTIGMSYKQKF